MNSNTPTQQQVQARKENWALFLLKGRCITSEMRAALPHWMLADIHRANEAAITYIKEQQLARKRMKISAGLAKKARRKIK